MDVSVIVPTYNRLQYLELAIDSIRRQGVPAIEIIVVDDGSNDGTSDAISSYPDVVLVTQANAGPSAARNTGLAHSTGNLVSFLDSDDVWPPGSLRQMIQALEPEDDAVMGLVQMVATDGVPHNDPFSGAYLGSGLYRRRIYEQIGGFDELRRSWEDLDWLNRAREQGFAIRSIDHVTLHYRRHDSNMSADQEESQRGLLDAIHRSLERRRSTRHQT